MIVLSELVDATFFFLMVHLPKIPVSISQYEEYFGVLHLIQEVVCQKLDCFVYNF